MFCRQCGNKLRENSKFCSKCGAPVMENEQPKVTEPIVNAVTEQAVTEEKPIEQPKVTETIVNAVTEQAATEEKPIEQPKVTEPIVNAVTEQAVTEGKPIEQPKVTEPIVNTVTEQAATEENPIEHPKVIESIVNAVTEQAATEKKPIEQPKITEPIINTISENNTISKVSANAKKPIKPPKASKEKKKKEKKADGSTFPIKNVAILSAAAVIVGVIGLWVGPAYINKAFLNFAADHFAKPQAAVIMRTAADGEEDDILKEKLALAKNYEKREEYGAAAALYAKLEYNGIEEASDYADDVVKAECDKLIQDSKPVYTEAFANLISNKDIAGKIKNTAYISAAFDFVNDSKLDAAKSCMDKIDTYYTYDADKYNELYYSYAAARYNAGEFYEAYKTFDKLGSYSDSDMYMKKSAYALGIDAFEKEQYAPAVEYFTKASGYEDSDAKLKDSNYYLGLYYYNASEYTSAKEYLSKVKGYKDTDKMLEDITKKAKYLGWYIIAHTGDYVYRDYDNKIQVNYNDAFSKYDDFYIYIGLYNEHKTDDYISLAVTITDSDGATSTSYINWMYDGSTDYVSFNYEYPSLVTADSGVITVSIKETGEVLGTYYFTID